MSVCKNLAMSKPSRIKHLVGGMAPQLLHLRIGGGRVLPVQLAVAPAEQQQWTDMHLQELLSMLRDAIPGHFRVTAGGSVQQTTNGMSNPIYRHGDSVQFAYYFHETKPVYSVMDTDQSLMTCTPVTMVVRAATYDRAKPQQSAFVQGPRSSGSIATFLS
eukprot:TRINITY_DN2992_c0_g1_i1.p2 TRINITY_DN2992_c0_g1~~TRINITY_DN2992_c0_g1_i1.p2  ORF type:complete len:184 (+),score=34.61 TRINITY_DN2992_c0_g1_i1:73-552(+)